MTVPLLSVQGLRKSFGGVEAVKGVSFSVREGEIHGIIGPNGAGKTTLFTLISGFLKANAGDIQLEGRSIGGMEPQDLVRAGMVRTFQNLGLFESLTVAEHYHLVARTRDRNACFMLASVLGLEPFLDVEVSALAYGIRKRVDLFKALATGPRLLLLDEPIAGLNASESKSIADVLRRFNGEGTTIVLVDHDMRFVMGLCTMLTVISDGRDIANGSPREIAANPDVVEAYLGRRGRKPDA